VTLQIIAAYFAAAIVFFGLDMLWLGGIARGFYQAQMGSLMGETKVGVAAGFYLIYLAGLIYFAVLPATGWGDALFRGAFLGLIAYGTYDLTNLATTRGWPAPLAFVDWAWGTTLTGVSAVAAWFALRAVG